VLTDQFNFTRPKSIDLQLKLLGWREGLQNYYLAIVYLGKMRFIQNPKVLQVIIFFLLLVSGLSIMAKIETEVKLSKTITILHGVESENQMLKTKIIELKKQISESNAEMR